VGFPLASLSTKIGQNTMRPIRNNSRTKANSKASRLVAVLLLGTALVWFIPGCATTKKKDTGPKYVFFFPAPEKLQSGYARGRA